VIGLPCFNLTVVAGLCLAVLALPAHAAPSTEDPDWPCQQRLVPELSAGTYWTGAPLPGGVDWRADPRVAGLVEAVAPRDVLPDVGTAKIRAFAEALKPGDKAVVLSIAFVGILEETNRERSQIIARLKELTRRQREIAGQVTKVTDEIDAIPPDATGGEADRRAEALGRQRLLTRAFDETRRTMRYACEAPTQLEARLGAYAGALQQAPR
jgi:hypothetical protein